MKNISINYRPIILSLAMVLMVTDLSAQFRITIDANVLNEETKEPIPYANLTLADGRLKTVANTDGQLILSFDERSLKITDSFKISSLNYKDQSVHALTFLKFLRNTNKIYLKPLNKIGEGPVVAGIVKVGDIPLQGSKVMVLGSNNTTFTNTEGEFVIDAEEGKDLVVSAFGMKPQIIKPEAGKTLAIELEPDGELLRQVYLEGRSLEAFKYDLGINGKKTFDQITYSANLIGEDQNKPNYYRIQDFLQGRASKLNYTRNASIFNDAGVIVDLDGMIYAGVEVQGDRNILNTIDPQNIKSISVLNSLTATHKYGTLGRGGVIVIRTKIMDNSPTITAEPRTALVRGNNYTEGLLDPVPDLFENYIKSNNNSTADQLKRAIRLQLSNTGTINPDAFMSVADKFYNSDRAFSLEILSDFAMANVENPDMLRLLAMKYETLGEFERAKEVFQQVLYLTPHRAQSYLDIAQIYEKTGLIKESFAIYKDMFFNRIDGIDFTRLGDILSDEVRHFLTKHRLHVYYKDIPNDLRRAKFNIDTRIVFEWLDPYKEFELQFVDPNGKYFIWMNNYLDNAEFMEAATKNGFSTEAFIIDQPFKSNWLVNILQANAGEGRPMYLKYTIYKNYGSPFETSVSKMVSFGKSGTKYRLTTVQ